MACCGESGRLQGLEMVVHGRERSHKHTHTDAVVGYSDSSDEDVMFS